MGRVSLWKRFRWRCMRWLRLTHKRYPTDNRQPRTVYANNAPLNGETAYCSNYISTTKYSAVTFIFQALWEQFSRLANAYFLVIGALSIPQEITPLNAGGRFSTIGALSFVVFVSIVKEAVEDYRRYLSDREMNSSKTEVLRGGGFVRVRWDEIEVGDIVRVASEEQFPADLVLLSSTGPQGTCYIETANLDGETNLKIKNSVKETSGALSVQQLLSLRAEVDCEPPNNELYKFAGAMKLGGQAAPVGVESLLLRGAVLRNTEFVHGLAVYTGLDTRLMRNMTKKKLKRSNVERIMNYQLLLVFVILLSLATFCTVAAHLWRENLGNNMWFLQIAGQGTARSALLFVTFLVLYSQVVPISLYVSLEMVKVVQCLFIGWDLDMYDAETDTPAKARTSNLNEELGQIQYVLTDKTGTLTRNVMEFKRCCIAGVEYGGPERDEDEGGEDGDGYGHSYGGRDGSPPRDGYMDLESGGIEPDGSPSKARSYPCTLRIPRLASNPPAPLRAQPADRPARRQYAQLRADPAANRADELAQRAGAAAGLADPAGRLAADLRSEGPMGELTREFFTHLAVCHTVVPERDKRHPQRIIYQAASPDEEALVKGARAMGFVFEKRNPGGVEISAQGTRQGFEVLNVLEFNSDRKRMSVVVRTPDGRLMLYTKGADTKVFERLQPDDPLLEPTMRSLERFAADGLRTLVIARAELDEGAYAAWAARHHAASVSLVDRERKVDEVAEELERGLQLLGATAIEDRLQDGVPDTLVSLQQAGIRVWVLTGDKQETAINIGFSCGVLQHGFRIVLLNEGQRQEALGALREATEASRNATANETLAMVIDGATLAHFLADDETRSLFMDLGRQCATVICCRVSPLQKAEVVRMVKRIERARTLAIGDGANDVGMIEAAHIGVGISGKEGMQAVLASDFAIAQFRFLKRLLLVHGRWSYKRITKLILYSFYKNVCLAFTYFWFNVFCGFSGQSLYEGWVSGLYNVLFCSTPVLVMATQDQDTTARTSLQHPELYSRGQENTGFNVKVFWLWALVGVLHSVVVFFLPFSMMNEPLQEGVALGMWAMGTAVFTALILTVSMRLALSVATWSALTHFFTWGSLVVYFVFLAVYSSDGFSTFAPDMYYVSYQLFKGPAFWLCIAITPAVALLPDFVFRYVQFNYFGYAKVDLTRRMKKMKKRRKEERRVAYFEGRPGGRGPRAHMGFAFSAEPGQAQYVAPRAVQGTVGRGSPGKYGSYGYDGGAGAGPSAATPGRRAPVAGPRGSPAVQAPDFDYVPRI
eukprot:tig00001042_g6587.t1